MTDSDLSFIRSALERMVEAHKELSQARRKALQLKAEEIALAEDEKELKRIIRFAEHYEEIRGKA